MDNSYFIENKVPILPENVPDKELLEKFKRKTGDSEYFDFLDKSKYVSFFFDLSIHIYGYNKRNHYNNIDEVNELLRDEFGIMFDKLVSFGQDVFGNQFCFDLFNQTIISFNVETGEREEISRDFLGWLNILTKELDYYSGKVLLRKWNSLGNELEPNQRLCPKIPFVTGGEYSADNLYAGTFPAYIKAYANIARQVYGLPEGTKVKLRIDK